MSRDRDFVRLVLDALFKGIEPDKVAEEIVSHLFGVRSLPKKKKQPFFAKAVRAFRKDNKKWINQPYVLGAGVGQRLDAVGEVEYVVDVYLDKSASEVESARQVDRSRARLASRLGIPLKVEFLDQAVRVDVLEIAKPKPVGRRVKIGDTISHMTGEKGTLGCFVEKNGEPGEPYLLSACHVIGNCGSAQTNDKVVADDYNFTEIATIADASNDVAKLEFSHHGDISYRSITDSAIAKLLEGVTIRHAPVAGGLLKAPAVPPSTSLAAGQWVTILGASSPNSQAKILHAYCKTYGADYCAMGADQVVGFSGLVMTDLDIADPGDSGSIVINAANEIVGLVVLSSDTNTWFHPIDRVLDQRKAKLIV